MTQQNAALVEEASAASETMTEQATSMMSLMGFFQATQSGAAVAAAPVPVQAPKATTVSAPTSSTATASRPVITDSDDDWQEF